MPYVRFSLMRPMHGQDVHARELIDSLVVYYQQQPGFMSGYRLEPADSAGFIGRMGVWATEADANAAAQQEHDLALRSRLNFIVSDHHEYSFEGVAPVPV